MPRIRFTRDVRVEARLDVCCFSGDFVTRHYDFRRGDEVVVAGISYGAKVKARGGAYRPCSLVIANRNSSLLHPDEYVGVPSNSFEVLDDPA